jgi:hypothetical protein
MKNTVLTVIGRAATLQDALTHAQHLADEGLNARSGVSVLTMDTQILPPGQGEVEWSVVIFMAVTLG